jgi:hypothetical protein
MSDSTVIASDQRERGNLPVLLCSLLKTVRLLRLRLAMTREGVFGLATLPRVSLKRELGHYLLPL